MESGQNIIVEYWKEVAELDSAGVSDGLLKNPQKHLGYETCGRREGYSSNVYIIVLNHLS